jgi:DNA repair exonuclease SbcCD nuclease subunit
LYLAHRTVDEAQLSNNWHLNSISYKIITKQTKADIIILGHVHRPQIIHKRNPLVLMPGSIARNNFTEGTEFKYIWLLTLDGKKIKLEKIKTFTRTHLDIIYDLSNKRLFVNDVECQKLDKETIKDSVTKITLRGTRELIDKVDIDKLYKKFIKVRKLEPIKYDYTDALNTRNLKVNNCKNNKNNTKELFKDYAKKTKLSKPVTKFIEKIIT